MSEEIKKDAFEPETALRYNTGKLQWSLLHYKSIEPLIRVLEYGRHKYSLFEGEDGRIFTGLEVTPEQVREWGLTCKYDARDNWKKEMPTKQILESMQRHLAALMDGEEFDKESGLSHIGHIQANALFYTYHKDAQNISNNTD